MKKILYAITIVFILQQTAYAAYVGNPSRVFTFEDEKKTFSVFGDVIADMTYDRKGKHQAEGAKVDFYEATAGFVYKNMVAAYAGAGASEIKEVYDFMGSRVEWSSDYVPAFLVGGRFKLYKKQLKSPNKARLMCDIDIQWRSASLEPDTIKIGSTEYSIPSADIEYSAMQYNDWHVALTCELNIGRFSPYAGLKYSDFESCLRVRRDGIMYEKDNVEASDNFGIFMGGSFRFTDYLCMGVEASFIDEEAVSGSLSWRF
ncbi:MAG: hypothetical protein HQ558_06370 [Candidatus Omnitrophica bacterium]|nr:hypothetical protein [Candidatus Omnitrophota bacterium]